MKLNPFYIDDLITKAISEDIEYIDVTTDHLIEENQVDEAYFVAKQAGIVAGLDVAMRVFEMLDPSFEKKVYKKDGDFVEIGEKIVDFKGHTQALLKGERTALNLMQFMSGIATKTHEACKEVEGYDCRIVDTRKTLPGLRPLSKYAVLVGGGTNHRYNLSDGVMLKDNHIDAGGGITKTVAKVRSKISFMTKIEVETRTLEEVQEAIDAKADVIMLDNMDNEMMKQAVQMINHQALVEASGNMSIERLKSVASCGVDIISIGALTHSVQAFDISMKFYQKSVDE